MNPEPSRAELLHRIAELEARLADYETGRTEPAFAREIAERKRAEQASRESEERLRLFMENVPVSIAMFDRGMRYVAASGRWAEYFGGAERMLGKPHYEVFPDCPERWKAAHRRGMAGETVRVQEDIWQLADGSEGWARSEVRPWRAANGDVGGIIIFTEDITERKQAEAPKRENLPGDWRVHRLRRMGVCAGWRVHVRKRLAFEAGGADSGTIFEFRMEERVAPGRC